MSTVALSVAIAGVASLLQLVAKIFLKFSF
jgi:hypothetical protein